MLLSPLALALGLLGGLLLGTPLHAQARHSCIEEFRDLLTATLTDVGEVSLSNGEDYIRYEVEASGNWQLQAIHAYAGFGSPPTDANGDPDIGAFPYAEVFTPEPRHALYIPMADMGWTQCIEGVLNVAIQVELVELDAQGNVINADVAWCEGSNGFSGTVFGLWFSWLTCCDFCGGPMELTAHPPVFKRGQTNVLEVTNGQPGKVVYFGANDGTIVCSWGRLLDPLGVQQMDIISPVMVLGQRTLDASGAAMIDVAIPAGLRPERYAFQAVMIDGLAGIDSEKSNALSVLVE